MLKRFFLSSIITVSLIALLGCSSPRIADSKSASSNPQVDPEIIKALEEIVAVYEDYFNETQLLSIAGLRDTAAEVEALINLSEARIRLAIARRQSNTVIQELIKLIDINEKHIEILKIFNDSGRVSPGKLADAKVQLIQLRIRLIEAQNEAKGL